MLFIQVLILGNRYEFQLKQGHAQLWVSDGTETGTKRVKSINASSKCAYYMAAMNNRLYFSADDGSGSATELWESDGTENGTAMLADIYEGAGEGYPYADYWADGKNVNCLFVISM